MPRRVQGHLNTLWTVEGPLNSKEIKPVNLKGNQPWIFIGRTDAETEASIFWPSEAKGWVIGKDPDAEKDCRQEGKEATEDGIVGWHHWLNRHEFEQTLGHVEEQGSLGSAIHRVAKSQTWFSNRITTIGWFCRSSTLEEAGETVRSWLER